METYQTQLLLDNIACDIARAQWSIWFNTQNPFSFNGNDMEDLKQIQQQYPNTVCDNPITVEYAYENIKDSFYHTVVNLNGLFCSGTFISPCPDYRIRFCCMKNVERQQCGATYNSPMVMNHLRIINGIEAIPHSWPWAVTLEYRGKHECGGVIIDQYHILTAAHCLGDPNDLTNYKAKVGVHHRQFSGQLYSISQLIIHPLYDENQWTKQNDIGIIKLAQPIVWSATVQPICLTEKTLAPPLGKTVFVAGWGNTIDGPADSSSDILLQARLRIVNDCSITCQGDSGGGLFYNENGIWYVAGIVSYALGCGNFPTVFTRTSAYLDWIQTMIR
ncbi:unnamed protein product [Didymodactylos carnosus]|uniref:Peptidase S1 domain-containing protein n=1 Tax=Didymodactylos carnosus TaxID=1234261 RepID=A0A813RZU5_9BILA|nr:unnamed protein product [Didymodactylos carnosus]CAF0787487.1 unnamed protein product [Didymodactylos carnosus]CAF3523324.1 unnamed protein product [Didymodactylos carnosus]CAF3571497.1 unnamed protein product [Didymodactylos carnosus]